MLSWKSLSKSLSSASSTGRLWLKLRALELEEERRKIYKTTQKNMSVLILPCDSVVYHAVSVLVTCGNSSVVGGGLDCLSSTSHCQQQQLGSGNRITNDDAAGRVKSFLLPGPIVGSLFCYFFFLITALFTMGACVLLFVLQMAGSDVSSRRIDSWPLFLCAWLVNHGFVISCFMLCTHRLSNIVIFCMPSIIQS